MKSQWRMFVILSSFLSSVTSKIITTTLGNVIGTSIFFEDITYINKSVNLDVYRGIPFAEPPMGGLRFKRPIERKPWSPEAWNATYYRNVCEQTNPNIVSSETSEDCLYLNIFVPQSAMPGTAVMVWFYGGAFLFGGGSEPEYDPTPLVAVGDVIIVTVNYRLGIYGFLTTGNITNFTYYYYYLGVGIPSGAVITAAAGADINSAAMPSVAVITVAAAVTAACAAITGAAFTFCTATRQLTLSLNISISSDIGSNVPLLITKMKSQWRMFVILTSFLSSVTSKIITTTLGNVIGTSIFFEDITYINKSVNLDVYRGIPFAEPPMGGLRFKRPIERKPWSPEVWNATYYRNVCEQTNPNIVSSETSEDCLYLNIFVPQSAMPGTAVMVWFYGGAFLFGGGSEPEYDPTPLVAVGDVIIVTVNYRLGIYGFLTTGDDEAPGNYGVLDQVLALHWIRDNIAAFNGDPNSITIFGESAGAASVHLHILSPLSRGLFQRGLMQSGSALSGWAVALDKEKAISDGRYVGRAVNCTQEDSAEFVACLRSKPMAAITAAQFASQVTNMIPFLPVVDNYFLSDAPATLVAKMEYQATDILIGNNHDEGALYALTEYKNYVRSEEPPVMSLDEFRSTFPKYIYSYSNPYVLDAIEHQYLDWTTVDNNLTSHLDEFIQLTTDQDFACPSIDVARAHATRGNRVYQYEMTHIPSMSVYTLNKKIGPKWLGATHVEEVQYTFGWGYNPALRRRYKQTNDELEMSVQFMRYWTNFAKYGDPNGSPNETSIYPAWPVFTIDVYKRQT
ncbi:acetylcholinesterase-like [Anneissia japonica]|uniref:acetylcholinesterase-like n=1 Tax=Anneissia japonica TaxID=1529436 RepID=UPI001425A01F|nr:acetylcholinesterase-like [Anneissia japonica]